MKFQGIIINCYVFHVSKARQTHVRISKKEHMGFRNAGIRRPLQRSSVRDILDLQSNPRSDDSGLETCSLDLLNPTIWYFYTDPARCGVDGDSMEIP